MKSSKSLLPLAVLLCLGGVFVFWRQFSSRQVNLRPSAAAGEVIASEVARLAGGSGQVILISRPLTKGEPDATGERVTSFTASLIHQPTLQLATEWAPRPPGLVMDLGAISPEQFLAAVDKNLGAKVVVVFAGLPPWSQTLAGKVSSRSLKVVAVCGYGPNVRRWLESKALTLAVVPRFDDPPAGNSPPKTAQEWFEREFQIITPESLAQLPY